MRLGQPAVAGNPDRITDFESLAPSNKRGEVTQCSGRAVTTVRPLGDDQLLISAKVTDKKFAPPVKDKGKADYFQRVLKEATTDIPDYVVDRDGEFVRIENLAPEETLSAAVQDEWNATALRAAAGLPVTGAWRSDLPDAGYPAARRAPGPPQGRHRKAEVLKTVEVIADPKTLLPYRTVVKETKTFMVSAKGETPRTGEQTRGVGHDVPLLVVASSRPPPAPVGSG